MYIKKYISMCVCIHTHTHTYMARKKSGSGWFGSEKTEHSDRNFIPKPCSDYKSDTLI